jgi:DNA-binding CsgD family transcriptional regulator
MELSSADLRRVLHASDDLLEARTASDVASRLLPVVAMLTDSDVAAYHHVSFSPYREIVVSWPFEMPRDALENYPRVMAEHPLAQYFSQHPSDEKPHRISEVAGMRTWHENPAYQEGHRLMGVDDEMALPLFRSGAGFAVISVAREKREYGGREEALLTLIRKQARAAVRRIGLDSSETDAIILSSKHGYGPMPPPPLEASAGLGLTARELEILALAGAGRTSRQIARVLRLSERTVNKHLEHIYEKLQVTNRIAALRRVIA